MSSVFALVLLSVLVFVGSSPTKTKEDTRIVGGHDIEIEDAPYQVSLVYRGRHSCGGAIIGDDLVVTAAHCVIGSQPELFKVRVGTTTIDGGQLIDVEDIVSHNRFSYSKMDYDIAILLLKEKLEFNEKIAAIDIANEDEEIDDGEITVVTGWGNTREGGSGLPKILQSVQVPTVGSADCEKAYYPFYSITPRMLCAGLTEGGKDACQGDSGGPLVHNQKLSGVVSWGIGCARPDYPGVYAKVSALRSWIDDKSEYLRVKKVLRGI